MEALVRSRQEQIEAKLREVGAEPDTPCRVRVCTQSKDTSGGIGSCTLLVSTRTRNLFLCMTGNTAGRQAKGERWSGRRRMPSRRRSLSDGGRRLPRTALGRWMPKGLRTREDATNRDLVRCVPWVLCVYLTDQTSGVAVRAHMTAPKLKFML